MWDANDSLILQKLELLAASLANEALDVEKLMTFVFSNNPTESLVAKEILKSKFNLDLDDPETHKKLVSQLLKAAKEKNV